jgi:APA family basic amino acid/polyamine antiporter
LARLSGRAQAPVAVTLFTTVVVAAIAGFFPLDEIAALANAGTLAAFTAVGASLIVLRLRAPDAPRRFHAPLWPLVGVLTILGCLYLFLSLPPETQLYFFGWNAVGLVVYAAYGVRHSRLAKAGAALPR